MQVNGMPLLVNQVVQVLSGVEKTVSVPVLRLVRNWVAERKHAQSSVLILNLVPFISASFHVRARLDVENGGGSRCFDFVHVSSRERARANDDATFLHLVEVKATRKVIIYFLNFPIDNKDLT